MSGDRLSLGKDAVSVVLRREQMSRISKLYFEGHCTSKDIIGQRSAHQCQVAITYHLVQVALRQVFECEIPSNELLTRSQLTRPWELSFLSPRLLDFRLPQDGQSCEDGQLFHLLAGEEELSGVRCILRTRIPPTGCPAGKQLK